VPTIHPYRDLAAAGGGRERDGLICVYDAVSHVERAALRLTGEITRIDRHAGMPLLACVDTAGYCHLVEVFLP
jgi:hypothetical protein